MVVAPSCRYTINAAAPSGIRSTSAVAVFVTPRQRPLLWAADVDVDWSSRLLARPELISLPGYPFERQRHWVEHNTNSGWGAGAAGATGMGADGSAAAVVSPSSEVELSGWLSLLPSR